jgi:hypothetical protein
MGIYTSNRYLQSEDYVSDIPVNEAYDAAFGCAHALAECEINDMALFESAIYSDIAEVRAMQEGYGYVNENAFTDVLKRVKEIFIKLIGKIKGIFASFLTKLTSAFKSGEDLVKKYSTKINSYQNWKGFKCKKIRKPIASDIKTAILDKDVFGTFINQYKTGAIKYTLNIKTDSNEASISINTKLKDYTKVEDIKEADTEDLKNAILEKHITGCDDIKEITKSVMDKLFEEEETIDDEVKDGQYFNANWIKGALVDSKDWIKEVKKYNDEVNKGINTIIDNLKKTNDNLNNLIDKKGDMYFQHGAEYAKNFARTDGNTNKVIKNYYGFKDEKETKHNVADDRYINGQKQIDPDYQLRSDKGVYSLSDVQKAVQALQKLATNHSEVITTVTNEYMKTVKFTIAQAKKLYTAAAVWSSGVHKESVEFSEAMGDVALEQFYSNMESL